MRKVMSACLLSILAGCAAQTANTGKTIEEQVAESKAAFDAAIPSEWSPKNFPIRVIEDYRSRGSVGVVAMDSTDTIATFEICEQRTRKCYNEQSEEAVAKCELTVYLGNSFDILTDTPPKCRIVIVNSRVVADRMVLGNVIYSRGDRI